MLLQLPGIEEWRFMSRISKVFEKEKVFIAFITGGDPNIETSYELIRTMAASGADIIEIGIPFSDPIAEQLQICYLIW